MCRDDANKKLFSERFRTAGIIMRFSTLRVPKAAERKRYSKEIQQIDLQMLNIRRIET